MSIWNSDLSRDDTFKPMETYVRVRQYPRRIMPELPSPNPKTSVWTDAVIGGVVSMPLSLGYYWWTGMGNTFSAFPIIWGGLLAGYLAKKKSRKPALAGVGAGIVGGLPAFIWFLPQIIRTASRFATAWSSPLGAVFVLLLVIPAVVLISALPGWFGGLAGGWLGEKIGGVHDTTVRSEG